MPQPLPAARRPKAVASPALPLRCAAASSLLLGAALLFAWPARAHDAPSGWSYPFACCSGVDCRPVTQHRVRERAQGYVIEGTGEVVAYSDPRVRDSPDGDYHWCSVAGADDSRTICLFVPPKSF